jgi:hypothetical protein
MADAVPEQAPSTVTLIVNPEQKKELRNTFILWELATLALGIYIGKKVWEPKVK